jgi:putative protease
MEVLQRKAEKFMKKVELLSPAGNFEKLKIALKYGADAVYGGVSHFSLRIRSSKEFSYESFEDAVKYVHSKEKKIYATINGFPFNSQIKLYAKHIERLAKMKVDAFIVSTPGVIKLCKQIAPDIPLHLSTQANVLNYLDAETYYEMGVKRIIAAREISLKDLKEIKKHLPLLELEIFIHGSMCFAYSGRCLISSLQSGRVANRGSCANDCRFPYVLYIKNPDTDVLLKIEEHKEGTYIMNAKDLNLVSYIPQILGENIVDSLKIEGRTKSPYYVAIVTKTYKKAIEDWYNHTFNLSDYKYELETTKHRGFSEGYLIKRPYEKNDTQKLDSSISEGKKQVVGKVSEDGNYFMAKGKICINNEAEIVLPPYAKIDEFENEIGKIYQKDKRWYLKLYKIITAKKELKCIHSGNPYAVKLPSYIEPLSFLRV